MTFNSKKPEEIQLLAVLTLVIWIICLAVGIAGMVYGKEQISPTTKPAAQWMDVRMIAPEVTAEPATPAASDPITPPDDPAPPEFEPGKEVALASPLPMPLPRAPAIPATQIASTAPSVYPVVRRLVYGAGEGRQPAPDYPRHAVIAHEEGTVEVLFDVDQAGHVTSAVVASPSPWPILNNAAVSTIRQRWRFAPGASRTFQVSINFKLNED